MVSARENSVPTSTEQNIAFISIGVCLFGSIPQNVARIAAGMFHEILLVVFLRRIEFRGSCNLRRNRPIELSRLSPSRLHALRSLFLCFGGVENCGTILCTGVVVLPVQRRGIVHAEKIIQQRLV